MHMPTACVDGCTDGTMDRNLWEALLHELKLGRCGRAVKAYVWTN